MKMMVTMTLVMTVMMMIVMKMMVTMTLVMTIMMMIVMKMMVMTLMIVIDEAASFMSLFCQ